jgi:hypothetical protein
MKRLSVFWLIAVIFLFLAACKSHSDGSEFVGKWVASDNPNNTVVIKRNGDNKFVITKGDLDFAATYANGTLKFSFSGVPAHCSYSQESDILNCFETGYTRPS